MSKIAQFLWFRAVELVTILEREISYLSVLGPVLAAFIVQQLGAEFEEKGH
jgi:hypothetical protein